MTMKAPVQSASPRIAVIAVSGRHLLCLRFRSAGSFGQNSFCRGAWFISVPLAGLLQTVQAPFPQLATADGQSAQPGRHVVSPPAALPTAMVEIGAGPLRRR